MKQKIALADIGAIPNPTFINNNHMFRSFYCALVSLAVIGILLFYSIKKLSTLGSVINYESYSKKNNPLVNVEGLQFNLTVQYINFTDPQNVLRQYINGQNMFQYGLNISVQHSSVDKSQQQIISMYLIDQKSQYYPYNYMSLPKNIPKELQTNSKSIYKKLRIIVEQCNSKLDAKCKKISSLQDIFLAVTALGQVNSDFANNININKYTEEWEDFVALQYPFTFNVKRLTFGAYQFTSHLSVFPKTFNPPTVLKSWCYFDTMDKDLRSLDIFNSLDQYYVFELVADNYSFYESEVMQKIDFILPQIFTVFSLAAIVLKVISSHYRRWALQLQAAHQIYGDKRMRRDTILSQNDQSKKIMGINLKNYFKFLTTKQKNNDQKLTETKIKLKKVAKKIDYIQMGKQIYKLERCLKILCRSNKLSYESVLNQIQNQPESDLSEQQQMNGNKSNSNNLLYSQ